MTDPATAPTAEELYKANLGREQEYVRVWVARRVKVGEEIDGMPITRNGYMLYDENDFYRESKNFLSNGQFDVTMTPAGDLALPVPKKDLVQERMKDVTPVRENQAIKLGPAAEEDSTAPCDGFTFMKDGHWHFLDNQQLMSEFNYAGSHFEGRQELLVTVKQKTTVKGIILDKDVTVRGASGAETYPAGTFVCRTGNGYAFEKMTHSANAVLRLPTPDHHQQILGGQEQLKKIWQKKKTPKGETP